MGARKLGQFVRYLAEHGVDDDQCNALQKLIDEGKAAEVKAHLSSWVQRSARDVLADKEASRNDLDIKEVVYRVVEDVAGLYVTMDAGVQKIMGDLSDETLQALVEHFEHKKPETDLRFKVMRAAQTERVMRRHLKKAQKVLKDGATSYCLHHQCASEDCIKKH